MPQVISSVKALICHQGKFLILKEELHKGAVWDLPGGKIEYGESPQETLHREIREELDLEIKIIKSVGVWYFFSQQHQHQVICHTFLCEIIGKGKIDLSKNPADEDISEWRWLTKKEILRSDEIELAESLLELIKKL